MAKVLHVIFFTSQKKNYFHLMLMQLMKIWSGGLMLVGTTKVWAPPRLTTETRPDSHNGPIFPFLQELQKFRACALANIIKQASVSKFSRNEKKGESSCYVLRPHIIEPTPTGILSRNTLADQHHDNHYDDHHQTINLMMTIIITMIHMVVKHHNYHINFLLFFD